MSADGCLSQEILLGFVAGTLSTEQAQRVTVHLDTCSSCETRVEQFETRTEGPLARLRQAVPTSPYIKERECAQAVARIEAIGRSQQEETELRLSPVAVPPSPTIVRDYRLLRKLGGGGMGEVFAAEHIHLKRHVALKLLSKNWAGSPDAIVRFRREMEAMGKLEHPNIVQATDAGEQDGLFYLVMEHVDGVDLSRLVKARGKLAIPDACELVRQAATGLQFAHERGMVHRDIKPSNLMLTKQGVVKVLDLGLARLRVDQAADEEFSSSGTAMGTPDYMAPEQVRDSHGVDIRADIYSLGCTLYKLLTGSAPFETTTYVTAFDKMQAHVEGRIPAIQSLRPDISDGLVTVLNRMVAVDRSNRFAEPAAVADALAPFCTESNLVGLAQPADSVGDVSRPSWPTAPSASSPLTSTDPSQKRITVLKSLRLTSPRAVATAGALFSMVLMAAIVISIRKGSGPDSKVTAPEGSHTEISSKGDVTVILPQPKVADMAKAVDVDLEHVAKSPSGSGSDSQDGIGSAGLMADGPVAPDYKDLRSFLAANLKKDFALQAQRLMYTEIATTIDRQQAAECRIGSALTSHGDALEIVVRSGTWLSLIHI